jgi:hypothetical protein
MADQSNASVHPSTMPVIPRAEGRQVVLVVEDYDTHQFARVPPYPGEAGGDGSVT